MRAVTFTARVVQLLVITSCVLFAVALGNVKAQDSEAPDSLTLAISPQLLDTSANPGELITNIFRLTNASETSVDIRTTPKNFTPRGEEGSVDLTEDDTSYSLAKWISVEPETVTIDANQTYDFTVTIDVPENAEPGSHFGSVVFQTIPPEDEDAVALVSQEIAPVILVKIAGDTTEAATIEEFTSDKSFYSREDTITFNSRIKNTGNVHFKPTATITIKNMFGTEVASFTVDEKNVLPDSVRQITSEWQPEGQLVGRYTAQLTLVTGEDNQIETAEVSFIVFPYQIILPIVLGVVVIVVLCYKGRYRIRKAAKALSGKDEE